jgi:transcriptional regulator with XRE-family HTH domain
MDSVCVSNGSRIPRDCAQKIPSLHRQKCAEPVFNLTKSVDNCLHDGQRPTRTQVPAPCDDPVTCYAEEKCRLIQSLKPMLPRRLPSYLRTYRKRAGLSQAELARLLGYRKEGQLSRLEQAKVLPSLVVALACQYIFQTPIAELFPGLLESIPEKIEIRLADFEHRLQQSTPKGRQIAMVAHKLEWLWERRQANAAPAESGHPVDTKKQQTVPSVSAQS